LLLACAWVLLPFSALSDQPIRIVVPVSAGGTLDAMARMLAKSLATVVSDVVVVENRPGAGAAIGTAHVVRSRPDGHTLLLGSSFVATNAVTQRLNFDPQVDLRPVITLSSGETLLVVHHALEVHSVADLPGAAQRRPGGLNCAAPPGQLSFACERLRLLLGGRVVTIPYPGVAPALNALAAGQVDLMFVPRGALTATVPSGRVRALATAGPRKAYAPFEHLPLLKHTWPEMVSYGYAGIYVAAETPPDLIEALNRAFNRVLAMPEVRQAMLDLGYRPMGGSAEMLGHLLAQEVDSYARIATQIGLKPQ